MRRFRMSPCIRKARQLLDALESEAAKAARANVDVAEEALRELKDQKKSLLLPKTEGDARLQFLAGLSDGEGIAQLDAERLAKLITVIGQESRAATQMSDEAQIQARQLDDAMKDAEHALASAKLDLAKQLDPNGNEQTLSVKVIAATDTTAQLELRYMVDNAGWYTFNELHLDRGDDPKASLKRNVFVAQLKAFPAHFESWGIPTGATF